MPIFEYQCSKCSHCFEMIQGHPDRESKIRCPKCGNSQVQRILSTFSCGGDKGADSGSVSACGPSPGRFS